MEGDFLGDEGAQQILGWIVGGKETLEYRIVI